MEARKMLMREERREKKEKGKDRKSFLIYVQHTGRVACAGGET